MDSTRFHTLDAMRGIAAIAVMLFHAGAQSPLAIPGGYLAADLFFVLSGFVLANAYEARLREGMTLRAFVQARLQRVYPVFWLGALTGCVAWGGSALTMFMVPTPSETGLLFEANAPLWSLLFELVANLLWALLAVRLGLGAMVAVLLALAALLVPAVLAQGNADLGAFWATALPGLVRTLFSFTMGIVLFRLFRREAATPRESRLAWLLLPALTLLLAQGPEARALFDLAMLGLALPLVVWLGASWEIGSSALATRLGGLSFPLYCIHAPFVAYAHGSATAMALVCAAMIGLSLAIDRYYDRPIQAWFKARAQSACPAQEALA